MSNHREKSTSGMRSWKMRIFLVWTLFPGGWAVTGPVQVTAEQGSSLAVSCSYEQGYELYPKYWCRPKFLWFCFTYIAQTNGSEGTMTQGRVSIRDNHIARSFMVTLGHVTPGDAGWYSCRVRRSLWFSLGHNTEVMVSAAVSTTSEGSNVSPLATNTLCPMCCGEPPVLSQLGITHLLLFLGAKLSVALVLVCGAAWVRCRRRNHDQENLQLLEEADSTRAPGGPLTPEPQGHPPAPFPPTLPALHQPSRPPRTRSCLALGPPPPVKPWPLLAAPELEGGEFGVQRAYVC
ncbi:CMRF35-like molecule 7 isoform X2 [Phalacrocorax aristotelis]|uniref:CMRF35-like molecule 7 isoform X2 n=1 Tax=Phalacrocorax aristotelis TaxID=126867 RepID=UPI003F4BB32F